MSIIYLKGLDDLGGRAGIMAYGAADTAGFESLSVMCVHADDTVTGTEVGTKDGSFHAMCGQQTSGSIVYTRLDNEHPVSIDHGVWTPCRQILTCVFLTKPRQDTEISRGV